MNRLRQSPQEFEFFQAVRLLTLTLRAESRRGFGDSDAPGRRVEDRLRFGSDPSLGFPGTQLVALQIIDPSTPAGDEPDPLRRQYKLIVGFLGLLGASGALPYHYTIDAIESLRDRERAMLDFAHIFETRLLHLFYQAWEKHQLAPEYADNRLRGADQHDGKEAAADLFTKCLLSLIGLGTPGQAERTPIAHEAHLRYGAFFAEHRRNATSLAQMLGDYFGVPVSVQQFRFQWLDIPEPDRSQFPVRGELRRFNNQLSVDAVLGSRVLDCQGRFRVRVGPLGFDDYLRFIREGDDLARASHLVRFYVRSEFDFDVQPILKRDEVPSWRLTSSKREPRRLGRTIWLKSDGPADRDFDQMAYESTSLGAG